MEPWTTSNHLEAVNPVDTIYTLKISHYIASVSIGIYSSFMRTRKVVLDTGSKYSNIFFLQQYS